MTKKPSLDEVLAFLGASSALIVHFSGAPKGAGLAGPVRHFPDDLLHVVAGHAVGGLSCSLVTPRDVFHGPMRHATGTVGLVLCPNARQSLLAVSPRNAGSYVDADGTRRAQEHDIDLALLEASLSLRGDRYNEWVVRDFTVLGLFVAEPTSVWRTVPIHLPPEVAALQGGPIESVVDTSLADAVKDFPALPIYALRDSAICRLDGERWQHIEHADVYRKHGSA